MSSSRIVLSSAAMALILASGSWYAAAAFPLLAEDQSPILQNQPGPYERRANPITPSNPAPLRTDYQAAEYPAEARAAGVVGAITLRITLDEVGRVVEARRTAFSLQVPAQEMTITVTQGTFEEIASGKRPSNPAMESIVRALDALTNAASHAVSQWRYEPPKNGPIAFDVAINFKLDGETTASTTRGRLLPSNPVLLEGAVRVGGSIKAPTKIKDVRPVYPPEAQAAKVMGMVIVEARIGADGSVEAAQILRSVPLLDQAAIEAVRQWKFTPTLLNGVPTPVIMTVTVNFALQ